MKGKNETVGRKPQTMLGMLVQSIPHHESKHIALYSFTGNMYGGRVMLPDAGGRGTDKLVFARAEETDQRCLYVNRNRPGYKKVLKTARI